MGVLEVAKPTLKDGIELADDSLQATATSTAGLFADLIPKCHAAFRAHPTSTGLKPITQKVKPEPLVSTFLPPLPRHGFALRAFPTLSIAAP